MQTEQMLTTLVLIHTIFICLFFLFYHEAKEYNTYKG